MLEDRRSLLEGVVGRDATVGPDLEDQLVVVGDLANAGRLDGVLHEPDRGEERIDRNDADRLLFLLVGLTRIIAAARLDLDFGLEGALLVERADDLIGIDDLDIGVGLDVRRSDGAGFGDLDLKGDRLALLGNDQDFLQVQDDVGDILDNSIDRLKLVVNAVDLDGGNGGTFNRAEENTTQRIADRVTVTGLERLSDELGIGRRRAFLDLGEFAGQFELSETFGPGGEF
jgi:hypothetical protein